MPEETVTPPAGAAKTTQPAKVATTTPPTGAAKTMPPAKAAKTTPSTEEPDKKPGPKVRVLVNNLGHKLYQAGDVTDDAEVVALLGDERNLVEKVK